jgi:APA family basic amino acid/polyamine antiporter
LYPPSQINTRTQTPVNSTVILGILTAVIGFVTDFATLANMVSIGTLFVFFVAAACLIFRRTYARGVSKPWLPLIHIVVIALFSIGMSTYYRVVTDK